MKKLKIIKKGVFASFLLAVSNEAISTFERGERSDCRPDESGQRRKESLQRKQVDSGSCRIEPKCFGRIRMIRPAFSLKKILKI